MMSRWLPKFFLPWITDVTTTPEAPPRLRLLETELNQEIPLPRSNFQLIKRAYPYLLPLQVPLSAERAFNLALSVGRDQEHWEIVRSRPEELFFEGLATSPVFKLKDDVVVEVRPIDSGRSAIHMRSRSRVGRTDWGTNGERIRAFLTHIRHRLDLAADNNPE